MTSNSHTQRMAAAGLLSTFPVKSFAPRRRSCLVSLFSFTLFITRRHTLQGRMRGVQVQFQAILNIINQYSRERYLSSLSLKSSLNGCIVQTKGGSSIWIWTCTAACSGGLLRAFQNLVCVCDCMRIGRSHCMPFLFPIFCIKQYHQQPSFLVQLLLWGAAWLVVWSADLDVYFIPSILCFCFSKDTHPSSLFWRAFLCPMS